MSIEDDEAARIARAKHLRAQIDTLKTSTGAKSEPESAETNVPTQESPHEFIQRRMRELKNNEAADRSSDS